MGTEIWIISLPLSDSILCLKIIHPPNFREEPINYIFLCISSLASKTKKNQIKVPKPMWFLFPYPVQFFPTTYSSSQYLQRTISDAS